MKARPSAYVMLAPVVLLLTLLWLAPIGGIVVLSFQRSSLLEQTWVGFDNYRQLLADRGWAVAIENSIVFSVAAGTLAALGGFAVALPLATMRPGWRSFMRTAFFLPAMSSGIIISQMWLAVFKPGGAASWAVGQLGLPPVRWLTERAPALFVIVLVVQLSVLGSVIVLMSAGLEGVPKELKDAARMDGAGTLRTWWHVDLMLARKAVGFVSLSVIASGFTVWETIYVLTRGGPQGRTASALYEVWTAAMVRQDWGIAAAESVMLVLILTSVGWTVRRLSR